MFYLGIDASTKCTGFALINDKDELVYYKAAYTKSRVEKAQSLKEEFKIIFDEYVKIAKEIKEKTGEETVSVAIETTSFGNPQTIMLLGMVVGIAYGAISSILNIDGFDFVTAENWRSKILGTDPEEDMSNDGKRNELKMAVANWAEKLFKFNLPLFETHGEGILTNLTDIDKLETYHYKYVNRFGVTRVIDMRINDISDAIGLAYCCKYKLVTDRKSIRIENKKQSNQQRTLRTEFKHYRSKVETYFKTWKITKSEKDKKKVLENISTLKAYYNKLKAANILNSLQEKFIVNKIPELEAKLNEK